MGDEVMERVRKAQTLQEDLSWAINIILVIGNSSSSGGTEVKPASMVLQWH